MGKWLDIKGPVVADTVYADNQLVAKDTAFTLPGIEFLTADVQAMGNMTVQRQIRQPDDRYRLRAALCGPDQDPGRTVHRNHRGRGHGRRDHSRADPSRHGRG